ncbi:MAG TPA: HAMP domain-containing sensor histidine kinase [Kofleriaceae bacterium]|nr:HAMP domain-containing sensor histidine kinase [Kofleriaceae bacterium]
MRFPPANIQLRRAQLILMLVALVPTILLIAVGIIMIVVAHESLPTLVFGILILAFCTSGITGYILGSIFLGKGASLVRVQNDFVSAISHELRTPVTSIRLLIESLKDGRLPDADRTHVLELLGRETTRLELLVTRVLELSRLESGHVFARDPVDVADLVDEAIAAFDAVTLTNPTPIGKKLTPDLVLLGDRSTLVRALLNLLTNAWKYTGDDKKIMIETQAVGRWIEIIVRDNGHGIERDEQRAIYEQFRRGRKALDSGAPGVGLGLAFVRTIVRGQHGKLDFESKPGETAFRIRLPRAKEPLAQRAQLEQRVTS